MARGRPKPSRGMGIIADPDRRGTVGINRGQQEMRRAKQARRLGSRSPGGFAEGGTIESFNTQVNRKYGGGGSVKKSLMMALHTPVEVVQHDPKYSVRMVKRYKQQ